MFGTTSIANGNKISGNGVDDFFDKLGESDDNEQNESKKIKNDKDDDVVNKFNTTTNGGDVSSLPLITFPQQLNFQAPQITNFGGAFGSNSHFYSAGFGNNFMYVLFIFLIFIFYLLILAIKIYIEIFGV